MPRTVLHFMISYEQVVNVCKHLSAVVILVLGHFVDLKSIKKHVCYKHLSRKCIIFISDG